MRPLDEWDLNDLQALIDGQVQEYLQLDYKASEALQNSDGKKAEIAKDVSAFANSAGGRIVYGIVEDKRYPTAIDDGSDVHRITKEWLENVIMSGISPRVDGVRVKEIALSDQRAAFVVDIPQASSRAPHQAKDKRYYKRYEFQSVPMEDYEVRDVLRRASRPDLVLWLEFEDKHYNDENDIFSVTIVAVLGNRSDEPALNVSVRLAIDAALIADEIPGLERQGKSIEKYIDGRAVKLFQHNMAISPGRNLPVYKEQPTAIFRSRVRMRRDHPFLFHYVITAPGFSKTRSFILRSGSDVQPHSDIIRENNLIPEGW